MSIASSNALSGITASMRRLDASASNLANLRSTGPIPATSPSQPIPAARAAQAPQVYQAISAIQSSAAGGAGVYTRYAPKLPSYIAQYDPSAPFANAQGMIAAPNVDPLSEMIDQSAIVQSFRASIAVLKTANEMDRTTFQLWA